MKEYEVEINGITHTLMLSDEDAKARGLTDKADDKSADDPKHKQHQAPSNKGK